MLPTKTTQTVMPERGRAKVYKQTTNMKRPLSRKLETLSGGKIINNAEDQKSLTYFPSKLFTKTKLPPQAH